MDFHSIADGTIRSTHRCLCGNRPAAPPVKCVAKDSMPASRAYFHKQAASLPTYSASGSCPSIRTRIPSGRSSTKHGTECGAANIPFNGSSWKATSVVLATLFRPALGNSNPNSCAFSRSLEKLKRNSRDTRFTLNPPICPAAICQSSSGIGSRPCFCLRHSANRALSFSKFLVAILVPPCGNHSNRLLQKSRTLAERTRFIARLCSCRSVDS